MAKGFSFRASAAQQMCSPVEYRQKHRNAQKLLSFVKMGKKNISRVSWTVVFFLDISGRMEYNNKISSVMMTIRKVWIKWLSFFAIVYKSLAFFFIIWIIPLQCCSPEINPCPGKKAEEISWFWTFLIGLDGGGKANSGKTRIVLSRTCSVLSLTCLKPEVHLKNKSVLIADSSKIWGFWDSDGFKRMWDESGKLVWRVWFIPATSSTALWAARGWNNPALLFPWPCGCFAFKQFFSFKYLFYLNLPPF